MNTPQKIFLAIPNELISLGLEAILKRSPRRLRVQTCSTFVYEELLREVAFAAPDTLVIDPIITGLQLPSAWRSSSELRIVALLCPGRQGLPLAGFDQVLSWDVAGDAMIEKIAPTEELLQEEGDSDVQLSPREVDVIKLVAKGLTNKEIAQQLTLSIHTVITHRRNIAKKLKIHSPSGLTIYAIVNNLVDIKDTKQ